MLRARVTGEFRDFTAEGKTIGEVFEQAQSYLMDGLEGDPPDFELTWIPEHEPKMDDDVLRWLNAWRDNANGGGDLSALHPRELLRKMILEYTEHAQQGRSLRP